MVFYSKQAYIDLDDILEGLLFWRQNSLTREFCRDYVSDIIDICDSLDTKRFHLNALYETHRRYGRKVYKYFRNKNTTWYIIYDTDSNNNIYVKKIISNHLTVS